MIERFNSCHASLKLHSLVLCISRPPVTYSEVSRALLSYTRRLLERASVTAKSVGVSLHSWSQAEGVWGERKRNTSACGRGYAHRRESGNLLRTGKRAGLSSTRQSCRVRAGRNVSGSCCNGPVAEPPIPTRECCWCRFHMRFQHELAWHSGQIVG